MDIWDGIKKAKMPLHINYLLIPVTCLGMDMAAAKRFNEIYFHLKNGGYDKIIRTKSGGISPYTYPPAWDIRRTSSSVEITYLGIDDMARIQFRSPQAIDGLSGRKAFAKFKKMLYKDYGIDLDEYALPYDKAFDVKQSIERPMICMHHPSFANKTYTNVHHIDFHSSYPAGLANTHPEFRPIIESLYNKRKEDDVCKAILNFSIGFMQSVGGCRAKWSHLSKDAIEDNNKRVYEMSKRLMESGRIPLLYNTDGIWYCGKIYHGDGEGNGLGQWQNDHINCKFRMKSEGAYEFIEDGIYHPVVRGVPKSISDKWNWGDIYKADDVIIRFKFDFEKGLLANGKEI